MLLRYVTVIVMISEWPFKKPLIVKKPLIKKALNYISLQCHGALSHWFQMAQRTCTEWPMSVFCPGYVPAHLPPSFHPCGAQESSSWLGPWPLMLPVDEGCLQDASHAHREGNGTPTPVLLPGKCHGWRSLVGCSPCGCRVGHDWATSLSLFPFMPWRRK